MKNLVRAYDSYTLSLWGRKGGVIPLSMMNEFATWFFKIRLGPPLIINPIRSRNMIAIADATAHKIAAEHFNGQITVYCILIGMLNAENMRTDNIDFSALRRVLSKGERMLPVEILGFE